MQYSLDDKVTNSGADPPMVRIGTAPPPLIAKSCKFSLF